MNVCWHEDRLFPILKTSKLAHHEMVCQISQQTEGAERSRHLGGSLCTAACLAASQLSPLEDTSNTAPTVTTKNVSDTTCPLGATGLWLYPLISSRGNNSRTSSQSTHYCWPDTQKEKRTYFISNHTPQLNQRKSSWTVTCHLKTKPSMFKSYPCTPP